VSDPLRIALLVDPIATRASVLQHAAAIARELLGLGHALAAFGAPSDLLPHASADAHGSTPGAAAERAEGGLLGFRPDVLIAYEPFSPTAWMGARVARKLQAALVLVVPSATDAPAQLPRRMLQGVGARLWGRYVRHTASHVVAFDPDARALALSKGFPEQRVSILPDGLDLEVFRPGLTSQLVAQHRIRGRVLLYTGPIERSRDLGTLIAAFAASVGQRMDWSLVLAGEGDARADLRAQAERLGVGDRVRWLPRPRVEELPGLLGASTLFAVPGRDGAVRGRALARAMACGLPAVTAELARLEHLIEPDGSALIARAGDVPAWTEAIQRAASSPMLRQRMATRARTLAEERFGWPAIARELERILRGARGRQAA